MYKISLRRKGVVITLEVYEAKIRSALVYAANQYPGYTVFACTKVTDDER